MAWTSDTRALQTIWHVAPPRLLTLPYCFTLFARLVLVFAGVVTAAPAQDNPGEAHNLPGQEFLGRNSQAPDLRANVDLVLVPVTVLDHAERVVGGLRAGNFVVLDNKVPQEIKFLSCEDAPISLIVILDASGSMGAKMEEARNAAIELFQASNPRDEFTVMTFGDVPRIAGSADSLDDIHKTVDSLQSSGLTALWDAMYLGITELKHAEYERKAMVVISDGGDNHSRYTLSEIKSVLKEADVQVYAIGMFDRYPRRVEEKSGPLRLDEVTSVTGGRVISVHDRPELRQAVTRISAELRNQYVLAYSPSNRERDGKWHKIKVQLKAVPTQAKFRLHAKQGYYGPAE